MLPRVGKRVCPGCLCHAGEQPCGYTVREILHIRHHSLFAPGTSIFRPISASSSPIEATRLAYRSLVWNDQPGRAKEVDCHAAT